MQSKKKRSKYILTTSNFCPSFLRTYKYDFLNFKYRITGYRDSEIPTPNTACKMIGQHNRHARIQTNFYISRMGPTPSSCEQVTTLCSQIGHIPVRDHLRIVP